MSQMHLHNIFPVPLMRIENFLNGEQITALIAVIAEQVAIANAQSDLLSHSLPVRAADHPLYQALAEQAEPFLRDFGFLLFGENLRWYTKEIWMNVLRSGGHQSMHNHANSFISGVVYLTDCHTSAKTVFHNTMGARQFVFANNHKGSAATPYNSDRWVASDLQCGDMLLFPSYMLHAVPRNEGAERITIAFNATPERLKSWDYEVSFNRA